MFWFNGERCRLLLKIVLLWCQVMHVKAHGASCMDLNRILELKMRLMLIASGWFVATCKIRLTVDGE